MNRVHQFGQHRAPQTLSLIHQRDIATAIELALAGAIGGHIVNIVGEAATTIYEIAGLVGAACEPSGEPVSHPWKGHADRSLARRLGFQPTVPTVYRPSKKAHCKARPDIRIC